MFQNKVPNVAAEWLALPLNIQEVPGLNLSPETGYPDWGSFVIFLSLSRQMLRHFLLHPFQLIIIIWCYIVLATDSIVKWTTNK
jgi:hypothetical protein